MKQAILVIALTILFLLASITHAAVLFEDDFEDGILDNTKWILGVATGGGVSIPPGSIGNYVAETGGILRVVQAETNWGGAAQTAPIAVDPTRPIYIAKRTRVHYANQYYTGSASLLELDTSGSITQALSSVGYYNYSYGGNNWHAFGFSDSGVFLPPIWDAWFDETMIYDPVTGETIYSVNNGESIAINLNPIADNIVAFKLSSYGWWTGHYQELDYIRIEQSSVPDSPSIIDLGTLGGNESWANSVNDSGQVVIASKIPSSNNYHAALYDNGILTDLGTLGGSRSAPLHINESGQIVGYSYISGNAYHRPFISNGGAMTDLGTPGETYSAASSINELGQIVGWAYYFHAFIRENGVTIDLGTMGGNTCYPHDINNSGQIVGFNSSQGGVFNGNIGTQHAFLWGNGALTILDTLGGNSSYAEAINEFGLIAGYAEIPSGYTHAAIWENEVIADLGTLGGDHSYAHGINDLGQVVGHSQLSNGVEHAFLYSPGSGMIDLNSLLPAGSGWELYNAQDINNNGQIVGRGAIDGEVHAFLMTLDLPDNGPPVADSGGPYTLNEGGSIILDGLGSDPDDDPLTYEWDLDENGVFEANVQNPIFSATNLDGPDSRTVVLRVTDDKGNSDTDIAIITIDNVAPMVEAYQFMPAGDGRIVFLEGNFSDPCATDTHTTLWDFGDGSTDNSGNLYPIHLYGSPGTYTVTLAIEDDDGGTGLDTIQVTASDQTQIIDLGTFGGATSEACDINSSGQVAGRAYTASGRGHAFLWEGGVMRDLGVLSGYTDSTGNGINDLGQVVGGSYSSSGQHAFLWEDGNMKDLGALAGHSTSTADAINDSGQVAGYSCTNSETGRAYIYDSGTMTSLGTLGGNYSSAQDINNNGQIAGTSRILSGQEHAFLWENNVMTSLGTLGGAISKGYCINDSGQIGGWSSVITGDRHAFLWEDHVMIDLGTLGGNFSTVNAVNNSGQVVGWSYTITGKQHAFLHNGTMIDLNDLLPPGSGWELQVAYDINDLGQIVGKGTIDGNTRAFLMVVNVPGNTPPMVEVGNDAYMNEGEAFVRIGGFIDPDMDIWSATVDYGDGSEAVPLLLNPDKTFELSHVYTNVGIYTVIVTVSDDHGGVGVDTVNVTVVNAPAQAVILSPNNMETVSDEVQIRVEVSDAGNDVLNVSFHLNGTPLNETQVSNTATPQTVVHIWRTFPDCPDGDYNITVDVNDGVQTTSNSVTVTVSNIISVTGQIKAVMRGPDPDFPIPGTLLKLILDEEEIYSVTADEEGMYELQNILPNEQGAKYERRVFKDGEELSIVEGDRQIHYTPGEDVTNEAIKLRNYSVSLSCPVELHVYDREGKHTGPNGNGSDLEIPHSWYSEGEELKEVVILNPDYQYRIVILGTGSGSFNLRVHNYVTVNGQDFIAPIDVQSVPITPGEEISFTYDYAEIEAEVNALVNEGHATVEEAIQVATESPRVMIISAPMDPIQIGSEATVNAGIANPGQLNIHEVVLDWGDGNTSSIPIDGTAPYNLVDTSHFYAVPGVYTIKLAVTDGSVELDESVFQYAVVYDPDAGFVTGGGWIHSPPGAYVTEPSLTGKANFGFVSKYKKGATVPTGQTQFNFRVADLNFHSTSYEWLVVAGPKAMFKGTGTINSAGNYGFMLSAIDGQVNGGGGIDKFRIKIWDKDSSDAITYDNQMEAEENADPTTAIGGGSIVIHGDPKAAPELLPRETCLLNAYPNPFNPDVWIPYRLSSDTQVAIRIHDITGRLARTLDMGYKPAGIYVSKPKAAHWDGTNESGEHVASGIYFYTLKAGDFSATKKIVVKK